MLNTGGYVYLEKFEVKGWLDRKRVSLELGKILSKKDNIDFVDQRLSKLISRWGVFGLFADSEFSESCFSLLKELSESSISQTIITENAQRIIEFIDLNMTTDTLSLSLSEQHNRFSLIETVVTELHKKQLEYVSKDSKIMIHYSGKSFILWYDLKDKTWSIKSSYSNESSILKFDWWLSELFEELEHWGKFNCQNSIFNKL